MSFCSPRISGRFFRGLRVRVSEEDGRPNDACRRTSSGRAVEGYICISFDECEQGLGR